MSLHVGVGGTFKDSTLHVGVGGAWKPVTEAWVGVGGVWKQFLALAAAPPTVSVTGLAVTNTSACVSFAAVYSAHAAWTNTDATLGIKIRWYINGAFQSESTLAAGTTSHDKTLATFGATVQALVVYYNTDGEGPSQIAGVSVAELFCAPPSATPNLVSHTNNSGCSGATPIYETWLQWTNPVDTTDGIKVDWYENNVLVATTTHAANTTSQLRSTTAGTAVKAKIYYYNVNGNGPMTAFSATVTPSTLQCVPDTPSAVNLSNATACEGGQNPPDGTGSPVYAITVTVTGTGPNYRYYRQIGAGSFVLIFTGTSPYADTIQVGGSPPGSISYRVFGWNGVVESSGYASATGFNLNTNPCGAQAPSQQPTGLSISDASVCSGGAAVYKGTANWTNTHSGLGIKIQWWRAGSMISETTLSAGTTTHTSGSLGGSGTVEARVYYYNITGAGPQTTNTGSLAALDCRPTETPTITSHTNTSGCLGATPIYETWLQWTNPTSAWGIKVDWYENNVLVTTTTHAAGTTSQLRSTTAGTAVKAKVYYTNASGDGPMTAFSATVSPSTLQCVPDAPSSINLTNTTACSGGQDPPDGTGSPVYSITITATGSGPNYRYYRQIGTGAFTLIQTGTSPYADTIQIGGSPPGAITYRVFGWNGTVESSTYATDGRTLSTNPCGAQAPSQQVTGLSVSDASVCSGESPVYRGTANWTNTHSGLGIKVQWWRGGSMISETAIGAGSVTHTSGDLGASGTAEARVYYYNVTGPGPQVTASHSMAALNCMHIVTTSASDIPDACPPGGGNFSSNPRIRVTIANMNTSYSHVTQRSVNGGTFSDYHTWTAGTSTFDDTSLTAGNTYTYRTRETDGTNSITGPNSSTITATAFDCTPPSAPTLTALVDSSVCFNPPSDWELAATLTWSLISGCTYEIWRVGVSIPIGGAGVGSNSYYDSGLSVGVTYEYYVKAVNSGGIYSAASNHRTVTIQDPCNA